MQPHVWSCGEACASEGGGGEDQDKRIMVFKTWSIQMISVCRISRRWRPSASTSALHGHPVLVDQFCHFLKKKKKLLQLCSQGDWSPQDASPCRLSHESGATMLNHLRERSRSLFPTYSRTPAAKEPVDLTNTCVKPWSSMQVRIFFVCVCLSTFHRFHCTFLRKIKFCDLQIRCIFRNRQQFPIIVFFSSG